MLLKTDEVIFGRLLEGLEGRQTVKVSQILMNREVIFSSLHFLRCNYIASTSLLWSEVGKIKHYCKNSLKRKDL